MGDEYRGKIKLLLMDCDGVLTDGRLYFSERGEELKVFDVKDGQGIAVWHKAGLRSGIISGRGSEKIVKRRAEELGIEFVITGSKDKTADMKKIAAECGLSAEQIAFVGDDLGDIDVMNEVGLSIAVADAVQPVREIAKIVTKSRGGRGAVREAVDLMLNDGRSLS